MRAVPNASKDGIDGTMEGAGGQLYLKVRVTAPPDKGKANKAILKLLAKRLGIPASAIEMVRGETDRNKMLRLPAAVNPQRLLS